MRSMAFPLLALVIGVVLGALAERGSSFGQEAGLRADVNLVSIYFTVRDKRDRLVTELTKDAFKVFEDGRQQDVSFFAHHSDLPMNVGVLLDISTSLERTLGLEADAA